jgi:hypothetical protein
VTFWISWSIDLVVALIAVYFFFIGLGDGSVSSFNMGLWLVILCVLGGVVAGSLALRAAARTRAATALVTVLAVPSALIGLFYLVLLVAPVRWN